MADIQVPRWLITQMCMPCGRRTAKKPVLVIPHSGGYAPGVYLSGLHVMHPLKPNEYAPQTFHGVFDGWEYRFWSLLSFDHGTITAECRACGNIVGNSQEARKLHSATGGCFKKLVAAFQLLRKDKRCVICDARTSKEKWGVPLCSTACTQAWCETETTPAALLFALQLIGEPK